MLPTADICDKYPKDILVAKPIFKDFGGRTAFFGKAVTLKTFDDNTKVRSILETDGTNAILRSTAACPVLDGSAVPRASPGPPGTVIVIAPGNRLIQNGFAVPILQLQAHAFVQKTINQFLQVFRVNVRLSRKIQFMAAIIATPDRQVRAVIAGDGRSNTSGVHGGRVKDVS